MKDRIIRWSERKYSEKQRILVLIPLATLFLALFPLCFWALSNFIDALLHLPRLPLYYSYYICPFLILTGLFFSVWSCFAIFKIGRGTPAPFMPTQRLIVEGPYAYTRNPMVFGIMLFYLGIGILSASPSFIGLVTLFIVSILAYVKLVEEKELEERFGQEYVEYKKRTPFLFPVPSRRS
jgi:protein-S-isoprenylcysteine O-methyltransferase Ste14